MPWGSNLAQQIQEEFDGYQPPAPVFDLVHGHVRAPALGEDLVEKRKYNKARRKVKPEDPIKVNLRKKKSRLKKQIEAWKTTATLIIEGRDLPSDKWMQILQHPVSDTEIAAFTDFVYFLRHKRVHLYQICGMLGCQMKTLQVALSSRK